MNAGALVYCLLDAEGEYTPEGYRLLDAAHVGEYELKLWQGQNHKNGEPVKFNEISLNRKGRSFDPASQQQKFPASTSAIGHWSELYNVVAKWINTYGDLYVGSYNPSKLAIYLRMFKRYLPHLDVSAPYAPFDECEGEPEYFHIMPKAGIRESVADEPDPNAEIDKLGDYRENIGVMGHMYVKGDHGFNFFAAEWFKQATDEEIVQLIKDCYCCSHLTAMIAKWFAAHDEKVKAQLYGREAYNVGFNEAEAYNWIKWNRPHLLPR